jgi:hypothetical protein
MDAAYYEDLARRLYGLLIMLEDRLGRQQAQLLHHFIEVGEYDLALEEIVGALAQNTIAITDQERGDMLTLARLMTMDDLVPHALESCPHQCGSGLARAHLPMCGRCAPGYLCTSWNTHPRFLDPAEDYRRAFSIILIGNQIAD